MRTVAVDKLVSGLLEIPEEDFVCGKIYDFLRSHPVEADSLAPYIFFSRNCYTRNLIFKNELFEMMAICWNVGQASLIHDHAEQSCWMTMPVGKLHVKNFRIAEQKPEENYYRLEETEAFDLEAYAPAEVNLEEPLHQVLNLHSFEDRAVSLHVYSRPFDKCNVFSLVKNDRTERTMCYTSMYGKLLPDARL